MRQQLARCQLTLPLDVCFWLLMCRLKGGKLTNWWAPSVHPPARLSATPAYVLTCLLNLTCYQGHNLLLR